MRLGRPARRQPAAPRRREDQRPGLSPANASRPGSSTVPVQTSSPSGASAAATRAGRRPARARKAPGAPRGRELTRGARARRFRDARSARRCCRPDRGSSRRAHPSWRSRTRRSRRLRAGARPRSAAQRERGVEAIAGDEEREVVERLALALDELDRRLSDGRTEPEHGAVEVVQPRARRSGERDVDEAHYGRSTARRGPARKPASTSSGISSVSATGSPSKRSTASRLPRPRLHVRDERRERRPQPRLVRLAQRDERPAAALDEQRRARRRAARRARRRRATPGRRPASATAARAPYGCAGIGRREHERLRLVLRRRAQLAQPLDRAGERELGAAEALDEVAAAAEAERLERLQLAVDGAVAAGDALGAHAVARDDAVALEQQLGERAAVGAPGEQPVGRATSGPAWRSCPLARRRENRRWRRGRARARRSGGRRAAASRRRS